MPGSSSSISICYCSSFYELVLPLSAFSSSSKATDLAKRSNEIISSSPSLPQDYNSSFNISSDGNIPILENNVFNERMFTYDSPWAAASKACFRSINSGAVNISSMGMYWALNFALSLLVRSIALSRILVGFASFNS